MILRALKILALLTLFCFSCNSKFFTIVNIGDTQGLTESISGKHLYWDMFRWIVAHKDSLNIVYVCQNGDNVQAPAQWQWDVVDSGYKILENGAPDIAYGVAAGNHDIGAIRGYSLDTSFFRKTFSVSRLTSRAWFGGYGRDTSNYITYQKFSAYGLNFLAVCAGYLYSGTVQWGGDSCDFIPMTNFFDTLISSNPGRLVLFTTHRWLSATGLGSPGSLGAFRVVNGNWLEPHDEMFLTFSGHSGYVSHRRDTTDGGKFYYHTNFDMQNYMANSDYLHYYVCDISNDSIHAYTFRVSTNTYIDTTDYQYPFKYSIKRLKCTKCGCYSCEH
jgi:hypothetical protein